MAKLRKDGKHDKREANGGQNKWVPTPEQIGIIKGCAAAGTPVEDICQLLDGIAFTTWQAILERQPEIAAIYKTGQTVAHTRVGRTLYKRATDDVKPDITAAIYYTKARMGWRDRDADVVNNNVLVVSKENYAEIRKAAEQYSLEQATSNEPDDDET